MTGYAATAEEINTYADAITRLYAQVRREGHFTALGIDVIRKTFSAAPRELIDEALRTIRRRRTGSLIVADNPQRMPAGTAVRYRGTDYHYLLMRGL